MTNPTTPPSHPTFQKRLLNPRFPRSTDPSSRSLTAYDRGRRDPNTIDDPTFRLLTFYHKRNKKGLPKEDGDSRNSLLHKEPNRHYERVMIFLAFRNVIEADEMCISTKEELLAANYEAMERVGPKIKERAHLAPATTLSRIRQVPLSSLQKRRVSKRFSNSCSICKLWKNAFIPVNLTELCIYQIFFN
jgi:hypothetical protein